MSPPRSLHSHAPDYAAWTKEELIARLTQLTSPLPPANRSRTRSHSPPRPKPNPKPFSFSKHPTRKIALRFSYVGEDYNGLAFQNGFTPLPTVEGVLFDALAKTRLIDGAAGFEGCGWERCGRTDRGVSAAGQVVSLWVRSAMGGKPATEAVEGQDAEDALLQANGVPELTETAGLEPSDVSAEGSGEAGPSFPATEPLPAPSLPSSAPKKELRYITLLNRVLPPSIRVHAFSPVDASFSARFNCRWRHYKYFFSPAHLDVAAMQSGATRLVGEHDFRNLCKLDPTKQITNFHRRVLRAELSPVSQSDSGLWVFDLVGTAFLYHQVRHIMAILLLIGAGLEPSTTVSALLNVNPDAPYLPFADGEDSPPVVSCKPEYQMADGLPLVLWDCGYGEGDLSWRGDDDEDEEPAQRSGKAGRHSGDSGAAPKTNLILQMQSIRERSHIQTVLHGHFLEAATRYQATPANLFPLSEPLTSRKPGQGVDLLDGKSLNVPLGGGTFHRTSKYVRLLERKRLEKVEVTNERWMLGKGGRRAARRSGAAEVIQENDGDE
ncbi:pseudouridine synthase [Auriscalpium vulgare]|uniref:Pseudouridine synthase n=1 Tax=Auriscalpium vulgare TaxID=40419 RepID=A0ACB8RJI1_9AGAM|nr:pseudouridine synthase [Auriscalpium vulgare]